MALKQPIPSPAEIAHLLKCKELGVATPIPPAMLAEIEGKLLDATERTRQLEIKVNSKKRSRVELSQAMSLLMEKYDFSPAEELMKEVMAKNDKGQYALDATGDKKLRIQILETLLEYTLPKLKSVEVKAEVDHQHHIHIVRYGDDGSVKKEEVRMPGQRNQHSDGSRPLIVDILAQEEVKE